METEERHLRRSQSGTGSEPRGKGGVDVSSRYKELE